MNKFTLIIIFCSMLFMGCGREILEPYRINSKWGFVNKNNEVKYLNYDETYFFNGKFAKIKINNQYSLIDSNGKLLLQDLYDWIEQDEYYYILYKSSNKMYSIVNADNGKIYLNISDKFVFG